MKGASFGRCRPGDTLFWKLWGPIQLLPCPWDCKFLPGKAATPYWLHSSPRQENAAFTDNGQMDWLMEQCSAVHGPMGEWCAYLHSRMLFVLLFHYVWCIRDASSYRGKIVAECFPPLPTKQLQLCPRGRMWGCLPSVGTIKSDTRTLESLKDLATQPLGSKMSFFHFSGKGHTSQATAS